MKKFCKTALFAFALLPGLFLALPAYSQQHEENVDYSRERKTEVNTVTVINTDEIRIVTNKQGEQAFQLKHLDILWGTRAALSGMIAAFLLLIATFTPKNSKSNMTTVCFITGCALTLSFYPLGISFMIYEWNQMYGAAAMAGGAILTALTLYLANNLRKKIKIMREQENQAADLAENSEFPFMYGAENDTNNFPPPPPPPAL